MNKRAAFLIALIAFASIALQSFSKPVTGTLFVEISGIKSDRGNILIYLYDKKETFPMQVDKAFMSVKTAAKGFAGTVSFEVVPLGTYAVSVIHDEDSSGKLSIGLFGPSESLGSSNDAKGFFGPPGFDDAKFEFKKDPQNIIINMN